MLEDKQYLDSHYTLSEKKHHYGAHVHLLEDPYLFTTLAKLGSASCHQPLINQLLNTLYRELVKKVVNTEFPLTETILETRMASTHPEAKFKAKVIDRSTQVVCVNLARAGTIPSQICFDSFNYILNPEGVRQDHISINRKTNDKEEVIGTQLGGLKIGGDISGRYVIVPDPMGATGSTIKSAMEIYRRHGTPRRFIAIHLIVTPEYLQATREHADLLSIYAIRLDRGLSPKDVLTTVPGAEWSKERGLNPKQYIVPGAGGLGEVINNAFV